MHKISEKKVKEIIKDLKKYKKLDNKKHNRQYYYDAKRSVVDSETLSSELIKEFLDAYNDCRKSNKGLISESIETDDRAETGVERDDDGNIQYYTFEIYRKNTPALIGKLTRSDMEVIMKLYSIYGANLTQKIVSREFPMYTFVEFKRILRAFNIYKSNSEFPLHMIEEHSEEELLTLHNQNKENNLLRKLEKDQLSEANRLINKLVKENQEYKNIIENTSKIEVTIENITPYEYEHIDVPSDKIINVYLADMHIGSKCESNSLYPNPYDREEIERRLNTLYDKLSTFGHFDEIVVTLLGDSLDGMDNQTARRDHYMPQNMDNMEQLETFIEVTSKFILSCRQLANKVRVYSVKCGNHGGFWEYTANLALQNTLKYIDPTIEFTLFKDYIGSYNIKSHTLCICHGKYNLKYLF